MNTVVSPWLGWRLGVPVPMVQIVSEHGVIAVPDESWLDLALAELRDRHGEIIDWALV